MVMCLWGLIFDDYVNT